MIRYYKNQFDSIRKFAISLNDEQYLRVINYLVDTVGDFIDGDSDSPLGRYYYHSAVESCKKDLKLETEENDADIDLLAFEFSMFM